MFKRGGVLTVLLATLVLSTTVVHAAGSPTPTPSGGQGNGPGSASYYLNLTGSTAGGSPPGGPPSPTYETCPPSTFTYTAWTTAYPAGQYFTSHIATTGGSITYGQFEVDATPPSGTTASSNGPYVSGQLPESPGYYYYAIWSVTATTSTQGATWEMISPAVPPVYVWVDGVRIEVSPGHPAIYGWVGGTQVCNQVATYQGATAVPILPGCSPNCGGPLPSAWNIATGAIATWHPLTPSSAPNAQHIIVYNPTFFTGVVPYQVESSSGDLPNGGITLPPVVKPVDIGYDRQLNITFVISLTPVQTEWHIVMSGANSGAGTSCNVYTYGLSTSDGGSSSCPGISYQDGGFVFTTDATNLQVSYRVLVEANATAYWAINGQHYSESYRPASIYTLWSPTEVGTVQQIQGSGCSSTGCG